MTIWPFSLGNFLVGLSFQSLSLGESGVLSLPVEAVLVKGEPHDPCIIIGVVPSVYLLFLILTIQSISSTSVVPTQMITVSLL